MTYAYEIKIDGKVVKSFTCKRPETAYSRFNREASRRGYTEQQYDKTAHGMMVWVKESSICKLIYAGFSYN